MNISCQTFSIQRILKSDSSQNKMSLMLCNTTCICMEHLSCFCGDECLMMIFPVNNNGNLNYSGKVISTGMKVNLLLSVSSSRSYFNFRIQILVATRYPGCDNKYELIDVLCHGNASRRNLTVRWISHPFWCDPI